MAPRPFVTADATGWWRRQHMTPELLDAYGQSAAEPHREWLLQGLGWLPGARTVLEVGCHCGTAMRRLLEAGYEVYGIDPNVEAVVAAQARGLEVGLGVAPDSLRGCEARTFDACVSSFALAYLAPADVVDALAEMLRLSRLGVVLVEPMAGPGAPEAVNNERAEWRHDYLDGLEAAAARLPGLAVEMTRYARGPHNAVNGMVVGRCRWPRKTT